MNDAVVQMLRCPHCGGALVRWSRPDADHALRCLTCAWVYPIVAGVPRMASVTGVAEDVARSFGFQWAARARRLFERRTLYGLSVEEERRTFFEAMGIRPRDLTGKTVLDAGCGDGFLLRALGEYSADVVGIDINTSIEIAHEQCRDLANVTVFQADIFAAPFAEETFDYVWCEGVLTHTEDPRKGFQVLSRLVKRRGRMYVWVYPREGLSVYQRIRDVLRAAHRMPRPLLFALCYGLAGPLAIARTLLGHRERTASVSTIAFALFDNLSPRVQVRHTAAEVQTWFEENGFSDLKRSGHIGMSGTRKR